MIEELNEFIQNTVTFESYTEELETELNEGISDIVTRHTGVDKSSPSSCLVKYNLTSIPNIEIDIYFKESDDKDANFKIIEFKITRTDCNFNEIL